jgi:hypothetical protein
MCRHGAERASASRPELGAIQPAVEDGGERVTDDLIGRRESQ